MKINQVYNCLVLLYLHAFCLFLCFQIEDTFLVELGMGVSILSNNSYWDLFLRMLFFSPFIGYYFFKKKEDVESNEFDKIFGIILLIMLFAVVFTQLLSCGHKIFSFDVPLLPGILCCGINFLALGLYYLWIYSQKQFINTNKVTIFRVYNIGFILFSLVYSCTVANHYTPYKLLELHHNDKMLIQVIDRIKQKNKVFNNIDEFIDGLGNAKERNKVKKLIQSKHLMYQKIDENNYKISWKTHLTKQEFNSITRWDTYYYPNSDYYPELYEKDNKIITINNKSYNKDKEESKEEQVQNNKHTEQINNTVKSNSNEVKSNNDKKQEKINTNNKSQYNDNMEEKIDLELKKYNNTIKQESTNNKISTDSIDAQENINNNANNNNSDKQNNDKIQENTNDNKIDVNDKQNSDIQKENTDKKSN